LQEEDIKGYKEIPNVPMNFNLDGKSPYLVAVQTTEGISITTLGNLKFNRDVIMAILKVINKNSGPMALALMMLEMSSFMDSNTPEKCGKCSKKEDCDHKPQ